MKAGITYNALLGVSATVIYLVINKFKIELTSYSVIMAAIFTILILTYVMIGFKIMKKGNMSLYTLFLMSGGMTIPYIWGVLFLNEELTIVRTIGLLAIIAAIVISNSGGAKPDRKQLLLCIAVFLLNGFTSVTSKMHQISPISELVTSSDFAFITAVFKAVLCIALLLILKNKMNVQAPISLPIKKVLPIVIITALADSISFVFQLIGATELPATILYPFITGGSIILTSLAGVIVFKEKMTARQWMGVAICFVGTLLFL